MRLKRRIRTPLDSVHVWNWWRFITACGRTLHTANISQMLRAVQLIQNWRLIDVYIYGIIWFLTSAPSLHVGERSTTAKSMGDSIVQELTYLS